MSAEIELTPMQSPVPESVPEFLVVLSETVSIPEVPQGSEFPATELVGSEAPAPTATDSAEAPVDPLTAFTPIITSLVEGCANELQSVSEILKFLPALAAIANSLRIPGVEKKDRVVAALHQLVSSLHTAGKISSELHELINVFVGTVVPSAIDAIVEVGSGRVSFSKPETVANVATAATATAIACIPILCSLFKPKTKSVLSVHVVPSVPVVEQV